MPHLVIPQVAEKGYRRALDHAGRSHGSEGDHIARLKQRQSADDHECAHGHLSRFRRKRREEISTQTKRREKSALLLVRTINIAPVITNKIASVVSGDAVVAAASVDEFVFVVFAADAITVIFALAGEEAPEVFHRTGKLAQSRHRRQHPVCTVHSSNQPNNTRA